MEGAAATQSSSEQQRIFCDVLQEEYSFEIPAKKERILARISSGIVGQYAAFSSPFGRKPVVYADWTASGRAVAVIEKYVAQQVLPFYANTHTTQSVTGLQSTCFRHEARQIIAQAVNAKVRYCLC
jgi:selenocysteine lyase/cysteine desulfurase